MKLAFLTMFSLFSLDLYAYAGSHSIPMIDNSPEANQKLDFDYFEKISQILYAGRMAPHMDCSIRVRTTKTERKFLTQTKLVEVLEIDYTSRRPLYAPSLIKLRIPADFSNFGVKQVANQWSGAGEDMKIEMNDSYNHWIRFTHDGKGQIVEFSAGNNLANYPCGIKN